MLKIMSLYIIFNSVMMSFPYVGSGFKDHPAVLELSQLWLLCLLCFFSEVTGFWLTILLNSSSPSGPFPQPLEKVVVCIGLGGILRATKGA